MTFKDFLGTIEAEQQVQHWYILGLKLGSLMSRNHAASCKISVSADHGFFLKNSPHLFGHRARNKHSLSYGFVWDSHILHQSNYLGVYLIFRHNHITLDSAKMLGWVGYQIFRGYIALWTLVPPRSLLSWLRVIGVPDMVSMSKANIFFHSHVPYCVWIDTYRIYIICLYVYAVIFCI